MGGIQGLDAGLGTLLGLLLRGYTAGLEEDRRKQAIAQQAQRLGVQPPDYEDSSYLQRMLNPRAAMHPLSMQESMLKAYEEQINKMLLEQNKQSLMQSRELTVGKQSQDAAMARTQYQHPEALIRSRIAANEANAAAANALAGNQPLMRSIMGRFMQQYGLTPADAPGAAGPGGIPLPQSPAPGQRNVPPAGVGPQPQLPPLGPPVQSLPGVGASPQPDIANQREPLPTFGLGADGRLTMGMTFPHTAEAETARAVMTQEAKDQATATRAIQPIKAVVNRLKALSQRVHTAETPGGAATQGLAAKAGSTAVGRILNQGAQQLLGTEQAPLQAMGVPPPELVSAYETERTSFVSLLRSLVDEKGNLSNIDMSRIEGVFPRLTLQGREATYAWGIIDDLIAVAEGSKPASREEIEAMISRLEWVDANYLQSRKRTPRAAPMRGQPLTLEEQLDQEF